jgi:hypothetical protein
MPSRLGSRLWIACEDSVGRKVWEAVQRMSVSALRYAQRNYVRDSSVVAGSLEDAAEAVLRVNRGKLERVRNLDAYLLRAFARKIKRHVARESKLVGIEYAEQIPAPGDHIFRRLLVTELIAMMDDGMRLLFERWIQGYSWGEIGRDLGIDPHVAEQQFYLGLRNLREKISKPPVPLREVQADVRRSQRLGEHKNQSSDKYSQEKSK